MKNIITVFSEIVGYYGKRVAVIYEEKEYTYEQLNDYSDYVAQKVGEVADKGDRIGICVERSFLLIASILGVLKAGMSYVPLDKKYPQARLKYMCQEANVACVIYLEDSGLMIKNSNLYEEKEVDFCHDKIEGESSEAYVIFTSGSSGKPKGVSVNQSSIMNTLLWRINYYSLKPEDRVLQIPSISYSSSVEDIFSTLLSGGALVMISQRDLLNVRKMAKYIIEYEVTHLLLIPSLYNEIIPHVINSKLRFVVVAGEALPVQVVKRHYKYMGNVFLYNEYGMTETSVAFSAGLISPYETRCMIGKPISNMDYELINMEDGVGELVARGVGVASGYLNRNFGNRFIFDKTIRKFLTGDLVREDVDGNLIYCGRKDSQIKINGKRFDLLEISNILKQELDIDAAVIIQSINIIVCFVSLGEYKYTEEEIENILKDRIPIDFLPDKYNMVEQIFKLPNGKIDYNKLKEYEKGKS